MSNMKCALNYISRIFSVDYLPYYAGAVQEVFAFALKGVALLYTAKRRLPWQAPVFYSNEIKMISAEYSSNIGKTIKSYQKNLMAW